MHPLLPSLAAAILYAGVTGYQSLRLAQRTVPDKRLLLAVGLLALLTHGSASSFSCCRPAACTDFFNASSLIAAAVILLILLALYRMPVENLLLLLFP